MLVLLAFVSFVEAAACFYLASKAHWNDAVYQIRRLQTSGQVGYFYKAPDQHQIFDALGFKRSRWSVLTPRQDSHKKTFRVLILGGSAVAGSERVVGGDWPDIVESLLIQHNPDLQITVVNGGVWGGISATERRQLFNVRHYDFDLLVLYTGYNDLYYDAFHHHQYLHDLALTQRSLSPLGKAWYFMREHSVALSLVAEAYQVRRIHRALAKAPLQALEVPDPLHWSDATREQLLTAVDQQVSDTLQMAQDRQLPVYLLFQANATYTRKFRALSRDEETMLATALGAQQNYWTQTVTWVYPALEERMRHIAARFPNVTYLDFNQVSHHYQSMFYDDVHFGSGGMKIVGSKIATGIQIGYLKRGLNGWTDYAQVYK